MKKVMFNDALDLTQSVLNGRKTQTRRLVSHQLLTLQWDIEDCTIVVETPENGFIDARNTRFCPYKRHETVAIAQSYRSIYEQLRSDFGSSSRICREFYRDYIQPEKAGVNNKMFVQSELMPHQILITGIRAERLQYISDEDCLKEGIYKGKCGNKDHWMDAYYVPNINEAYCTPQIAFSEMIDKVSGKGTWDRNPWVWVFDFQLINTIAG